MGFEIFGEDTWLRRNILRPTHNAIVRVKDGTDWLKYRLIPRHQYHLVDTGLKPGYYDPDYRLLNAAMALLVLHVEEEMGGIEKLTSFTAELRNQAEPVSEGTPVQDQADNQSEIEKIYLWWKVERPKDLAREEFLVDNLYGNGRGLGALESPTPNEVEMNDELDKLTSKIHKDEQSYLHRLVDVRPGLWI